LQLATVGGEIVVAFYGSLGLGPLNNNGHATQIFSCAIAQVQMLMGMLMVMVVEEPPFEPEKQAAFYFLAACPVANIAHTNRGQRVWQRYRFYCNRCKIFEEFCGRLIS